MALKDFLQIYGYSARELPTIAGSCKGKNLIVCGDAECIWKDIEAFGARCYVRRGIVAKPGWDIMTINKLVEVMPADIDHIYSNAPELLRAYVAARRGEYIIAFKNAWQSHSHNEGADWQWPFGGHGTSSLGGVLVGIGLGYDSIVLCGIPLDDGPHNGEPPWRRTGFESSEAAGDVDTGEDGHWKNARLHAFEGKVKSMSGRTREWLGAPA